VPEAAQGSFELTSASDNPYPLASQNEERMMRVRRFMAEVSFTDSSGLSQEQSFPVYEAGGGAAKLLALSYVLQILELKDFELRIVGA